MALIKCPECGKEISDKAKFCSYCGYPIIHYEGTYTEEKKYADGVEHGTKLFYCIQCGRPLPEGIEECIYCGHIYDQDQIADILRDESKTGILGRKNLYCPRCGSKKIQIKNDIPLGRKIFEVVTLGSVMPTTKAKYRKGMEYYCKICGYQWKEC